MNSLKPAAGVHLHFLDNQGVLLNEMTQRIYHLNSTVAFIWCLLEDGKDHPAIIDEMVSTFGLSNAQAEEYLDQSATILKEFGVLQGYELPAVAKDGELVGERHSYEDGRFTGGFFCSLLSSTIRVRFSDVGLMQSIRPVLAHLIVEQTCSPNVILDVVKEDKDVVAVYRDRCFLYKCTDLKQYVPMLKSAVWNTAAVMHDFYINIHGGVVSDGQQCYLFPASPGSGKSTLTAALSKSGFEFYTDEMALLHENTMHVEPVPMAICVKDTGIDVLKPYYSGLEELPKHLRPDGKRVCYLPPPIPDEPLENPLRPVAAILFPVYRPGAKTEMTVLSNIEALQRLLLECPIIDSVLNSAKIQALLDWIEETPCYLLTVSDLGEAIQEIRELASRTREIGR